MSILERWEPQWRFLDRWMVKTGFCQRQFRQTNEHQRYLNKKLNIELHGELESMYSKVLDASYTVTVHYLAQRTNDTSVTFFNQQNTEICLYPLFA